MIPAENVNSSNEEKAGISSKKRIRIRYRKKKSKWKRFKKTLRTSPLKIIAPFFLVILVFVSILFFLYDDGEDVLKEDMKLAKKLDMVYGILIPKQIINEKKDILIELGQSKNSGQDYKVSVSQQRLGQGFGISPMDFITCGNEGIVADSSKFVLSIEGDRLYITANFKNIFTDENAGSLEKKQWTSMSKDISQFYSDDNLFEVLDNQGYVMFSMQFIQPAVLLIRGYFVGERCIYIASEDSGLMAQPKTDNYLVKASQTIKRIKRNYSYK